MNKLSRAQLDLIVRHIRQARSHPALQAELVDHMAALIEQQMDQGRDFPAVFEQLVQHTNSQVLNQLKQHYNREFMDYRPTATQLNRRAKRRPATKPFYYIFLSSGLTLLILMVGFLIVLGHPLSVPIGVFQVAWAIGLAGLGGVGVVRWWLTSRFPKPKPFATG